MPPCQPLTGTILSAVQLAQEASGINPTWRVVARTEIGDLDAYAKAIDDEEIMIETACAMAGIEMGLPIPRPMLLHWEGAGFLFGSEAIPHPTLQARLNQHADIAATLATWKQLPASATFDEWIANPDRHAGNLITDGAGSFWLIDHGLAMRADPSQGIDNRLLAVAIAGASDDLRQRKLLNAIRSAETDANGVDIERMATGAAWINRTVLDFLQARIPHINRILSEQVTRNARLL